MDAAPDHVVNSFRPTEALGAGLDRIARASTDKVFTESILKQMLSAGWQTVTYRQNTELHVEAWHWNPEGTWSDGDKGYFVGNATLGEPIRHSFGYPLPHAGFSQPDGNSYSRLTDGDTNTYWKSNPYLTKAFTGQDDSLHPQWVVIDLAAIQQINAIRIDWADPYARKYLVQYFTGRDPLRHAAQGSWITFSGGDDHQRNRRQRYLDAFEFAGRHAIPAHLDDRVVQHLRHSRFGGQAQLRRLRHSRALCRHFKRQRLSRRRASHR